MNQSALKKFKFKLPAGPGIYMFKNNQKKNLYIGKASNLKGRLDSYLKTNDPRIKKMVELAQSLKFLRTNSDIEALILESQLIKKFRPQFNIMMRDDKQYFYVGFTNEVFPKIFLTHQPWTSGTCPSSLQRYSPPIDGCASLGSPIEPPLAQYPHNFIGPFTDGNTLKATLKFLRRIFPYCTCANPHNNFCLNYHIGNCLGFCCLKNKTRTANITNSHNAFIRTHYENLTRDLMRGLREYKKNIRAIKGVLTGKKRSVIKNLEREMIQSAQKGGLEKALELKERLKKLKRVFENAKIIQKSNHTHISIYGYDYKEDDKTKNSLIKILGLSKMPVRVEGYDVSNIQGNHATGSTVTFVRGRPDKNFYRKFQINTKQTSNDTAMLKEILCRRFKHEEWPFPNLIVVDGGKGQVNTTVKTLEELAIKIPIVGVSKNERHLGHQLIIPRRKAPFSLNKLSPASKNFLLTINSEAHRFAINYYRKKHRRLLQIQTD